MVKKGLCIMLVCFLLGGCGAEETMETVADEWVEPVMAPAREIRVSLPEEIAPLAEDTAGALYIASDYEIHIQTMAGGDLDETIRSISGYEREDLTVIETGPQGLHRYDLVWTAAGEGGDRIGRAVIVDDGTYHYSMTVLRDAASVETDQIVWRTVFESFSLV